MNDDILIYLKIMLQELEYFYLDVKLVNAPNPMFSGHNIRIVENSNPEWYKELCSRYLRERRNRSDKFIDSKIKRDDVKKVLYNLINNGFSKSYYSDDLLELANERFEKDKEYILDTECPF